jgi:uncharacterized protein (DUF2147 family)
MTIRRVRARPATGPAILLLLGALACGARAGAADPGSTQTLGNWVTERREAVIQISLGAGGVLEGRVLNIRLGPKPERRSDDAARAASDGARRDPATGGELILSGMNYDGAGAWSGGIIRDPRDGTRYRARLHLLDAEHLHVRGFIGIPLLGRSTVWTRYHGEH